MKYLFLDTSSFFINCYIVGNDIILKQISLRVEKDMSNKIVPLIRELFQNVNFRINDINRIFVTVGPGSFTGVRIGLTVAKTISTSLNIPLLPISTLEYLACINTSYKKIVPIIDARRGNVFTATFDNNLTIISKEQLMPYDNIVKDENTIITSYDGFNNSEISHVDILRLISKHKNDSPINAHNLVPNYLKKTEAEEILDDKRNNQE